MLSIRFMHIATSYIVEDNFINMIKVNMKLCNRFIIIYIQCKLYTKQIRNFILFANITRK